MVLSIIQLIDFDEIYNTAIIIVPNDTKFIKIDLIIINCLLKTEFPIIKVLSHLWCQVTTTSH